jgi:hypothetical protein
METATFRSAGDRRYATVNGQWPDGPLPKLDGDEAIAAAIRLYRFAMKKPLRRSKPLRITSGNRRTSIYYGRVNPERGWRDLVHSVSHHCHWRLHPNEKAHDGMGRHAFLEREMIQYVVDQGWLEGKLKKPERARATKIETQTKRYESILARITAWERKRQRAETALKKLDRQRRYYAKQGVTIT